MKPVNSPENTGHNRRSFLEALTMAFISAHLNIFARANEETIQTDPSQRRNL